MQNAPVIITNFKTYETASGVQALELAKLHEEAAQSTGKQFAIAVQLIDLAIITQLVDIPVFAQHIDPVGYGSNTGFVVPDLVKKAGAYGTLLNHSEHRLEWSVLEKSVKQAREVGLALAICAKDAQEGQKIKEAFNPDYVCVEPPELIGGDISVSTAQPELISQSVELIGDDKVLVGAGVKNQQDVRVARELGAQGVLLASGVTKAQDPLAVLIDLAAGL
jgi:triosephosphate isomerase